MKKIKRQPITKKHLIPLTFLCLILLFCLNTASAASDVIYVNNETGDDTWDGQSDVYNTTTGSGPKLTIKNATGTVTSGGTVNIADGLYTGDDNRGITITKDMTIKGQNTDGTIIDAEQQNRIFTINSGITVTIQNLTLTNGKADYGGAIYNDSTITSLSGCTFTGNKANINGGAIFSYNGIGDLTDCAFTDNVADYHGGAIYCGSGGIGDLTRCTFTGNKANNYDGGAVCSVSIKKLTDCAFTDNVAGQDGGAIYVNNGINDFTGCTFTDNVAGQRGGAIYNEGDLTVTNCTFQNNTAYYGGAIFNSDTLNVTDSTFTDNTTSYGGAICNYGTLNVTGSTFTENNASEEGGAIFNAAVLTVTGANFDGNTASLYGGAITAYGALTVNYSRFVGNTANTGYGDAIRSYVNTELMNTLYNWWGSNSGPGNAISGAGTYNIWLMLNISADPTTINTGETSNITADVYTDSNEINHSADANQFFSGAEVTFTTDLGNVGSKSITVDWNHGLASATLTGDEGPGVTTVTAADGTEIVSTTVTINSDKKATTTTVSDVSGHAGDSVDLVADVTADSAVVDGGVVNFTVDGVSAGSATVANGQASTSWTIPPTWTAGTYDVVAEYQGTDDYEASEGQNILTVIPSAGLYLKVTSSNDSPRVGETFTLTYKLGNKGPDPAKNVIITFQVPESLEFVNIIVDTGDYTYDPETRTVTWTLDEVPVGDPYLYLTVKALESGEIVITNEITSDTYNTSSNTSTVNINILPTSNGGNDPNNTVQAATIPMQKTGVQLAGMVLAILMVLGGFIGNRKN